MGNQRKQAIVDKCKNLFGKLPLIEQIAAFNDLGEYIKENVKKEESRLNKEAEDIIKYAETILGQR